MILTQRRLLLPAAVAALAAVGLSGCTLTLPMTGSIQLTNETFTGHATGHMDGAGELVITSSTGAR